MKAEKTSYRTLLAKPGFAGLLLAVSAGRLASGLIPFGLMAVFFQTDKYLSAGVVSVCFMLAASLSAPWRGRLIDRASAQVVLPWLAAASVIANALAFLALHGGTSMVPGVALTCVGAALAPINSAVLRSIWSAISPDEMERKALHALDSTLEECVYVVAPLVVGSLWFMVGPSWAVLAGGIAIALGTGMLFFFARRAGEEVWRVLQHKSAPASGESATAKRRGVVFSPAGLALTIPMFSFALCMGMGSIAFAAWSAKHYAASFTSILAALGSVGGVVGGLLYGKASVSDEVTSKLYLWMPACVGVATIPMLLSTSAGMASIVALCSGLVMTPMFIAAYMRVPATFARDNLNEANASIGSSYNLGAGLGSLLAGVMVERLTLESAFIALVGIPVGAAVAAWAIAKFSGTNTPTHPRGASASS